jgi:MFS family permease
MIADRMGGEKLCQRGLFLGIIAGPLIFWCAQSGQFFQTLLGQGLYALVNGMVSSTMMTLIMRHFQAETRYSGSSIGWSIGAAIFGGTALLVAETLVTHLGFTIAPGLYISLVALLGWITLKSVSKTTKEEEKISTTLVQEQL